MQNNAVKTCCKPGFTLIELLVVVLIIGILAAVALPQYNKAVEKSKVAQGIFLVKALSQAAQSYYLENGNHPTDLAQLEVSLSDSQKDEFWCSGIKNECNKKEWGISIYHTVGVDGIVAWRTSGKYKGGGFIIYTTPPDCSNVKAGQLYCYERAAGPNAISTNRDYCVNLLGGKNAKLCANANVFELP